MELPENIRLLRRRRNLTQEVLAEALGVTVSAVSKWESGATAPDLGMLVELASFFEVSVDALLGYRVRKDTLGQAVAQMRELRRQRRLDEAVCLGERTLRKHPNAFSVVYEYAMGSYLKGMVQGDKGALNQALTLYRRSLELLEQNTDPDIGAAGIQERIWEIQLELGQQESVIQELQKANDNGRYSDLLGHALVLYAHRPEAAMEPLSQGLAKLVGQTFRLVNAYCNAWEQLGEFEKGLEMARWAQTYLQGLKPEGASYLDKMEALVTLTAALFLQKLGRETEAQKELAWAWDLTRRFDDAPDFNLGKMRFFAGSESPMAYDTMNKGAVAGICRTLEANGGPLLGLWRQWMEENGQ